MVQAHGMIEHPQEASAGVMLYFFYVGYWVVGCSLYYSLLHMSEIAHSGKKLAGREVGLDKSVI